MPEFKFLKNRPDQIFENKIAKLCSFELKSLKAPFDKTISYFGKSKTEERE